MSKYLYIDVQTVKKVKRVDSIITLSLKLMHAFDKNKSFKQNAWMD